MTKFEQLHQNGMRRLSSFDAMSLNEAGNPKHVFGLGSGIPFCCGMGETSDDSGTALAMFCVAEKIKGKPASQSDPGCLRGGQMYVPMEIVET